MFWVLVNNYPNLFGIGTKYQSPAVTIKNRNFVVFLPYAVILLINCDHPGSTPTGWFLSLIQPKPITYMNPRRSTAPAHQIETLNSIVINIKDKQKGRCSRKLAIQLQRYNVRVTTRSTTRSIAVPKLAKIPLIVPIIVFYKYVVGDRRRIADKNCNKWLAVQCGMGIFIRNFLFLLIDARRCWNGTHSRCGIYNGTGRFLRTVE